ncbi:MAG TPA: patatin-like phospholipase family protein [Polyangiaceae bacterium]|nr:patatin-like phospholipase family protein [Polyangiaceae bacterium]
MKPKIAVCLPGGGAAGAMFQIGALAALEDALDGLEVSSFDLYVGSSGGASVAAALAGGLPIQRIYRAFLDPADVYFGLERKHLLRIDFGEWRRTVPAVIAAFSEGAGAFMRGGAPPSAALWEQLDRLADALPAGLFSLEGYERFLEEFFIRRGVPNSFFAMPRPLRILAHDLESAELRLFGSGDAAEVPVTRACIASMAIPPFFSPVRIGDRHYLNPGGGQIVHAEVAVNEGADVLVVVNPLVPLRAEGGGLRDRGLLTIINQAIRIGSWRALRDQCRAAEAQGKAVLSIEPEPAEGLLFFGNPASFDVRRRILEYAYRHARALIAHAAETGHAALTRAGWTLRPARSEPSRPIQVGG